MWILRGTHGDETFTFRVSNGASKTMGRAPRADFIVDAPLVSRVHCRVAADDNGLHVYDLASTNGTFVNDREIMNQRLVNGDRLKIGRVEFTVAQDGQ